LAKEKRICLTKRRGVPKFFGFSDQATVFAKEREVGGEAAINWAKEGPEARRGRGLLKTETFQQPGGGPKSFGGRPKTYQEKKNRDEREVAFRLHQSCLVPQCVIGDPWGTRLWTVGCTNSCSLRHRGLVKVGLRLGPVQTQRDGEPEAFATPSILGPKKKQG